MPTRLVVVATFLAALSAAPPTCAQTFEPEAPRESRAPLCRGSCLEAPRDALELTLGGGYARGYGGFEGEGSVRPSLAAGVAFELGTAYRAMADWSVGVTGQYQETAPGAGAHERCLAISAALTYHLTPRLRYDPWVRLGTGYRMLWEGYGPNDDRVLSHGVELAQVAVGLDVRLDETTALGPAFGAALDVFLWHDGASVFAPEEPRANAFVFAGVQGRFDLGGARPAPATSAAAASARLRSHSLRNRRRWRRRR